MKKIITVIILFVSVNVFGQDFSVAVSYLRGEKSKDSHSSDESIAIDGKSLAYSLKYSGHKGKGEEDVSKVCEFTDQDIKNIKKTIIEKNLNVNDSLFDKQYKTKSIEFYTNISIAIKMDGQEYKVRINGDTEAIGEENLYQNAVFFINVLKKMSMDCK